MKKIGTHFTKHYLGQINSISTRANIAVVGGGRMGELRIQGIKSNPRAKLAYVIDEDEDNAKAIGTEYSVKYHTKLEHILDDVDLDAVWISTPTDSHYHLIQLAAQAGKMIAVEKPVSASVEEIYSSYQIAQKNNVKILCSFQRRFDPSYIAVKNVVKEGELGRIQSIHTVFRDHPTPSIEFLKRGGDPFHDLAVHDINYVCDVVGEYPTEVFASGTSFIEELAQCGVMDKASVLLKFPSGIVCTMDLSRGSTYGYDQRAEIFCSNGMLQVGNHSATSKVCYSTQGISKDLLMPSFPERFRGAYQNELDHFVDIIKKGIEPTITCEEACMATIIAEACRLSAISDQKIQVERHGSGIDVRYIFKP